MRGSFIWNGVDSAVYGVHITRQPDLVQSAERITFQTVPGRHGTVAISQGINGKPLYDDVIMSIDCIIDGLHTIEDVGGWLTGYGELELPFLPNRFFKAHVTSQIPFSQIMRGREPREFTVTLRCDPFVYFTEAEPITCTGTDVLFNPGNMASEPKITVTLNGGNAQLDVGGATVFFSDLTGDVTLDCAAGIAYKGPVSVGSSNIEIADDYWPLLLPGFNSVNISGGIAKAVIEPRWRSRL